MATVTGDKQAVRQLMEMTLHELGTAPAKATKSTTRKATVVRAKPAAADVAAAAVFAPALARIKAGAATGSVRTLGRRRVAAANERGVKTSYAPRDREIAAFQSAMDAYLRSRGIDSGAPKAASGRASARGLRGRGKSVKTSSLAPFMLAKRGGAASARKKDIGAQYGFLDPGWLEVVKEKAKTLFKGKHKFKSHAKPDDFRFDLADKAKIAIVGDWGGGNAAAQSVAKQIAKLKPDHVIHLGDVYYSGTPDEVRDRFLKFWPTPAAPGMSFALNSNHEMYSGGYGYFDLTLPKFKQPASYFSLANENWRFVGLDTGYDEHDLHGSQVDWLKAQLEFQPTRRTVLLTHHQLFSVYEKTDTSKLAGKVAALLPKVFGWIWGHEHLAVVYKPKDGVRAICLGNGCFPYKLPAAKPAGVEWIDTHTSDDPYYEGGHTFALITLDGAAAKIEFIDEGGKLLHTETWP